LKNNNTAEKRREKEAFALASIAHYRIVEIKINCAINPNFKMVFDDEDDQNHRKGKGEEDGSDTDNTDNESQADDKIDLDSELAASNSTSFDPVGTVVGWGTGVANFVTNAVDTVYALPDIYNGLSEAWTEERCYERIMCETYDRTSEHWLWEYIVPIFEPMYPSFYRARNVARSTVKCEGFYSECVNLDRVYRWRDGRL